MPDNPYFDHDGTPRLHDSVVLFLDLLGTSGPRSAEEALDQLRKTRKAIARAREQALSSQNDESETVAGASRWFSDNLGLSYAIYGPWDPTTALGFLITEAGYLQLALALEGFFSRGAVARGDYFSDESFIHGPALERAVELEKTRAKSPRIVLDQAAVAVAYQGIADDPGPSSPWREQLLIDAEGTVFIDYLATVFEDPDELDRAPGPVMAHRNLVEQRLFAFDGVSRVDEKYRWLACYHNDFIDRYARAFEALSLDLSVLKVTISHPCKGFDAFGHEVEAPPEDEIGA